LRRFPVAKKSVGEKFKNAKYHHGVIVNYNTKSNASPFFDLPGNSTIPFNYSSLRLLNAPLASAPTRFETPILQSVPLSPPRKSAYP
jgi:hypothetical protein